MSGSETWTIDEPTTLDIDGEVTELRVATVGGAVNVVGTTRPGAGVRVEVSELVGRPLTVTREGSRLVIGYRDTPWDSLFSRSKREHDRHAVVSVSVPEAVAVTVGTVTAPAVVSGIGAETTVRTASAPATLAGLRGPVDVRTASGDVEAEAPRGPFRFQTASGDLTVLDGACPEISGETVSGRIALDLSRRSATPELNLKSVSGSVTLRSPATSAARVRASSLSGNLVSEFEELTGGGGWPGQKLGGVVGEGTAGWKISTVSGGIAVLRHPLDTPDGPTGGATGSAPDTAAPAPLAKEV
ncbi:MULTISPECIES: DUF4097 family beta strand repeat-containing protein [unclassified Streptomyces]|uniref:DUF4097 family beta strand repeat-containing protein n=1 Tax=unclassified Streptomyces TaxID=2593676 RepID=UPI000CD53FE2|nr:MULTISPECIES: hypothetical protein [unclassified Streptomyces]